MAALGSQSIASSYEQLLHVDRDDGGNTTTLVNIKDGDNGTTFALQLATTKVQANGTLTVGVDDTGYDVKFFGASAGAYALYDESADTLEVRGATAAGPGKLKLSTGELTVVDGDVLGRIDFGAPLESDGTDAILSGAAIWAEADATFSSSVNSTDLVFATNTSAAATERMRINSSGHMFVLQDRIFAYSNTLKLGGSGDSYTGVIRVNVGDAEIYPETDDAYNLGASSRRFDDIYATNATIQTSDERMKDDIVDSPLGLQFVKSLRPIQYKWKDYNGKSFSRKHYGLIAQEIEQVLTDNGMTTDDFAPLIYDEESDRYGMRYGEYVGILIKAVQELSAKVEALEG